MFFDVAACVAGPNVRTKCYHCCCYCCSGKASSWHKGPRYLVLVYTMPRARVAWLKRWDFG